MEQERRAARRPRVVHLEPRPFPSQHSIQRVFSAVRSGLPETYDVEVVVSSYYNQGLLPRLRAVLEARRRQGDVTHVVGDAHYLTLLLRRRRSVLTVHDAEFLTRAGWAKRVLYTWLWLRLPVRRVAAVTVPSEQTRRELLALARVDPAAVRVVGNPLLDAFTPDRRPAPTGRPTILLMGTWPNKNLPRSVAALTGLDCRVVLVGQLDDAQRRMLDGAGLTWEHRAGLDDAGVVETYRECDLLLFPSTSEGFGMPIIEAQATGRPVVTSDRPPMTDVAGGAAELVDPTDVGSIRAGVERVLGDPSHRDALVEAGLDNVRRYRLQAVAAQYAAVYDEVLAGATR